MRMDKTNFLSDWMDVCAIKSSEQVTVHCKLKSVHTRNARHVHYRTRRVFFPEGFAKNLIPGQLSTAEWMVLWTSQS